MAKAQPATISVKKKERSELISEALFGAPAYKIIKGTRYGRLVTEDGKTYVKARRAGTVKVRVTVPASSKYKDGRYYSKATRTLTIRVKK